MRSSSRLATASRPARNPASSSARRALTIPGGVRIELGFEQPRRLARQLRVAGERLLHVGLAERNADLQQILAVGAQHRDLAPVQALQHQLVEAVVLGLAAPHPGERLLKGVADLVGVELRRLDRLDAEVVQPEAPEALGHELVGLLLDRPQAHVLEHRQDVRQRNGVVPAGELQAQHALAVLERAVQRHRELGLAARQLIDPLDVGDGRARRHLHLVAGRHRRAVGGEQPGALLLPVGVDQRLVQAVGPRARGFGQARLELDGIDLRRDAGGRAHDEMDAGEDRFRDLRLELDLGAAERLLQDILEAAPDLGVVSLARHVDQARDEPGERIAAQEQPDLLPLLQMQDFLRDLEQLVLRHLEQLVARIGLEDVGERLGRVPGGRQVGARHHRGHLVPKQGNVARIAVVGRRGEQAEEAVLAHHPALGVETLDADEIQIDRAMHRRAGVRLGDHQRHRVAGAAPDIRRQGGEAARGGARRTLSAQQPERRALDAAAADRRPWRGPGRSSRSRGR